MRREHVPHFDAELEESLRDALLCRLRTPLLHDVLIMYLLPPLRFGADAVRQLVELHFHQRAHGEARVLVPWRLEGGGKLWKV